MHDHARTMTFSGNSMLIRLYKWAWEPERSPDFCKLFWGTLFLPLAMILHGLFAVSEFVNDHLKSERTAPLTYEEIEEEDAQGRTGPGFFQNLLTNIGGFFDKIAAFFQSYEWVGVVIMSVIVGTLSVAILGGLVLLVIEYPLDILYAVIWAVSMVIICGVVIALVTYLDKTGKAKRAAERTTRFFKRVGQFLSTGYHAVKYRTCPAIVIEDPAKI